MSEQSQDLTSNIQELMAQMAQMKAELDSLKARASVLPQAVQKEKPVVSTTRRKLLRQLAGGLVAGLTVAGIGVTNPNEADAKISINPSGNGLTGQVGMLVMPPGTSVSGFMGGVANTKVGILVSGDYPTFSIPAVVAPTVNSAIIGYTSNGGTAIAGLSQSGVGIYGHSDANFAIWGKSTSSHGVYGSTSDTSQTGSAGVYGSSNAGTYNTGVYGTATGTQSRGVQGITDKGIGVIAQSTDGGIGIYASTTTGTAVRGIATMNSGKAGVFDGDINVYGTLFKTGGSFKIDHPLDPANKYLYHSFVESPDMMNIYNGIVLMNEHGEAVVEMPEWFEPLNFDFRYQLTCLGQYSPVYIAEKIVDRKFKIAGGKSGQEVSWMVTGIRQDEWAKAHRIPVEEDKTDKEKGKYLHPDLYGKPKEMTVSPRPTVTNEK